MAAAVNCCRCQRRRPARRRSLATHLLCLIPAEEREAATSELQEQLAQDKANAAKMVHEAKEGRVGCVCH